MGKRVSFEVRIDSFHETFKNTKSEGDLLCYVEDFDEDIKDENIFVESMDNDSFYEKWFNANLDIIPKKFGGYATEQNKP